MKIAIVGSAQDSGISKKAELFAKELGQEIANRKHVVLYGPEISMRSLSQMVAKEAKLKGATTIAIAKGRAGTSFFYKSAASIVIYTDGAGGATREVVLINSADGIISIGGGSGTLAEIAIAYMNHLPIVSMKGSGGWSDKLIDQYIDDRKKYKVVGASSAKEAVDMLESLILNKTPRDNISEDAL